MKVILVPVLCTQPDAKFKILSIQKWNSHNTFFLFAARQLVIRKLPVWPCCCCSASWIWVSRCLSIFQIIFNTPNDKKMAKVMLIVKFAHIRFFFYTVTDRWSCALMHTRCTPVTMVAKLTAGFQHRKKKHSTIHPYISILPISSAYCGWLFEVLTKCCWNHLDTILLKSLVERCS